MSLQKYITLKQYRDERPGLDGEFIAEMNSPRYALRETCEPIGVGTVLLKFGDVAAAAVHKNRRVSDR